jgi:hypothetical protein
MTLSDGDRENFARRKRAITLYLAGADHKTILAKSGVQKAQLYKLVARALTPHADGRIYGFRALIPYERISASKRSAQMAESNFKIPNKTGAFEALLIRHPVLRELLDNLALKRRKAGLLQEPVPSVGPIHQRFLQACRKLGLERSNSYPFSAERMAYSSVSSYIRKVHQQNPDRAAVVKHGRPGRVLVATGDGSKRPVIYAFERVECDAHKIDCLFCILILSPFGELIPKVFPRLWVIVIQEVVSRAVLGYYLSFSKECNEDDLLQAIKKALSIWHPRVLSVPDLEYAEGAGFPSSFAPHFIGACWDEFSIDGAKINRSARVTACLKDVIGSEPPLLLARRIPNDRPFVGAR